MNTRRVRIFFASSASSAFIVYVLMTVMGFVAGRDGQLMGMAINMPDNVLHLAIGLIALYLGFSGAGHALPPPRGPDLRGA